MSNLQPNCCLEFDFQKVDQHAGGNVYNYNIHLSIHIAGYLGLYSLNAKSS